MYAHTIVLNCKVV